MPFDAWTDSNLNLSIWRLVVLAIATLAVNRLPPVVAMMNLLPDAHTVREALFIGYFGPSA